MFLHPVLEFMNFLVHLWPLSSPLAPQSRQGLEGCSAQQKGWGLGWMGLPQASALLEGCGRPAGVGLGLLGRSVPLASSHGLLPGVSPNTLGPRPHVEEGGTHWKGKFAEPALESTHLVLLYSLCNAYSCQALF